MTHEELGYTPKIYLSFLIYIERNQGNICRDEY